MTDYTYERIRRIPPPSDPPGIPEIECSVCKKWTSEETIVWADAYTGSEGREGEDNVFPFCQGCCPGDMPADEYIAYLIGHGLDNHEIATIMAHKWGHKTPQYLVGAIRDRIEKPERRDLKEVLMHLGNDLVAKHRYEPSYAVILPQVALAAMRKDCPGNPTTDLITAFTEFMNLSEEAREVLDSLGLDWSMPREVQGDGTQDSHR